MQMNYSPRPALSVRQLQALLALVEAGNFTQAAAHCHLSQPAFSAQIAQLEQLLGARLFERSTRHVATTPEGQAFAEAARRVLAELDLALEDLSDRLALRRGRVSVALLPSLAAGWFAQVWQGFHALHPGVALELRDVLSQPCVELVRSGRADLALAAIRVDTPELRADPFCSDRFHLVCRHDHPLAAARHPSVDDVARHPFIQLGRDSSVRQYLDAVITPPRRLDAVMEVDQLATVAAMVRAGVGVSVVPALTLFQFGAPELRTVALDWPGLERQIFLIRRRDRSLSAAAQALCEHLRATPPGAASAAPAG